MTAPHTIRLSKFPVRANYEAVLQIPITQYRSQRHLASKPFNESLSVRSEEGYLTSNLGSPLGRDHPVMRRANQRHVILRTDASTKIAVVPLRSLA